MKIILQRFANREYRLTQQSVVAKEKAAGDKYVERQMAKYAQAVQDCYVLSHNLHLSLAVEEKNNNPQLLPFSEAHARAGIRALDIINEFHLKQRSLKKGGWGHLSKPTSFTRNARHRLLEAGAIIDTDCKLNAWEVTCTIPGSTSEAFRTIAENTGWIMNEITRLIRKAKCQYWFYVWELQKRGALHLHVCVADPNMNLELLSKNLEQRWWGLLQSLCTRSGVDVFEKSKTKTWRHTPCVWQSHTASIKKSVAAYFSKYAGKSASPTSVRKGFRQVYTPSRWWGSSSLVKKRIQQERQKYQIEVPKSIGMEIHKSLEDFLAMPGRLKTYKYSFDLGKTENGTNLGGGNVCINYYDTQTFKRMQTWEKEVWEYVCMIARNADMANADMGCLHVVEDVPMTEMCYKHPPHTPPPSPHSQHSPPKSKLSKARGIQAKPTLALRALLVEFLRSGDGEEAINTPIQLPPIQGELFS